MTTQPEALRLADAIERAIRPEASFPLTDWARAAAELRRLHAENAMLWEEREEPYTKIDMYIGECNRLERERDALLEALHKLCEAADDSDDCRYGTLSTSFVRDTARAAIKAAEENT